MILTEFTSLLKSVLVMPFTVIMTHVHVLAAQMLCSFWTNIFAIPDGSVSRMALLIGVCYGNVSTYSNFFLKSGKNNEHITQRPACVSYFLHTLLNISKRKNFFNKSCREEIENILCPVHFSVNLAVLRIIEQNGFFDYIALTFIFSNHWSAKHTEGSEVRQS